MWHHIFGWNRGASVFVKTLTFIWRSSAGKFTKGSSRDRHRVLSFRRLHGLFTLEWRHNGHDGVSNHQPHHYWIIRLFRRRAKKTPKLRVTGLCARNSLVTGEFPHKRPVTRKMFPFDDVIMNSLFRRTINEHQFRATGSLWRNVFPFDDVIMLHLVAPG